MLKHLSIKNYILIRELDLDFEPGFSAITGETGAGKSILIGALSLILGNRADTDVLLEKNGKCIIEGTFGVDRQHFGSFFEQNELDFDGQIVMRREISNSGKSRAFINDTPVKLPLMKALGERLVDIHSQHETLLLNESGFQLAVLDNYAGNKEALQHYATVFEVYTQLTTRLDKLKARKNSIRSEEDFIRFQFEELEKANLQEDELNNLEEEQEVINHAEEIKSKLYESLQSLLQSDDSLVDRLTAIVSLTGRIADYQKEIKELHERLQSTSIELKDIGQALGRLEEGISFDPARLEEVSDRLNLIYSLMQKHKVQDIAALIELKNELDSRLNDIENIDGDIEKLEEEVSARQKMLEQEAMELRKSRKSMIPSLEKEITSTLKQLGMEKVKVEVRLDELNFFTEWGRDMVGFLFSANPGSPPAPVSRIASGGEMSRFMLALKSMITKKNLLPTVILDEIDMGVSGEIAARVGKLLKAMSENMQLIAITHLPQIAGKASQHFKVFKEYADEQTVTEVVKLSDEERVNEIAAMMSDEIVSQAAKETAKELLQKN
ncbi:MAG: DNA repair protein RecN [Bacteroidales bacterium]|nr:DNA repair protein RecN [Bacteroidales bacterium]